MSEILKELRKINDRLSSLDKRLIKMENEVTQLNKEFNNEVTTLKKELSELEEAN